MALRKLPGKRDRWLYTVLHGTPMLRELADAVRCEIEGGPALLSP